MAVLRTGMAFRLLVVLACLLGMAASIRAEIAVVTLTDGRRLEGELIEQDDQRIVLRIAGINTPLDRDQISNLEVRPSIEEQYRERKAALDPQDLNGRYDLAFWLFQEGRYDLATSEANELRQLEPDSERVQTLVAAIESKREMAQEPPAPPRDGQAAGGEERGGEVTEQGLPLLDERQINLIKVWELPTELSEAPVRIRVPRGVLERALADYGHLDVVPTTEAERRQLLRASPQEQLNFLFDLGAADPAARALYREVEVVGDPQAIIDFRRMVYGNYVQRYFRRHFGAGQVPGFRLVGPQSNTNAEVYTNFFILSQTTIDGRPMIDRQSPANSLFLQWGLPRETALLPAPDVEGWRPFFAGPEDPAFERMVAWIETLYDGQQLDYGIDYPGLRQDDPFAPAPEQRSGIGGEQAPPTRVQPPVQSPPQE